MAGLASAGQDRTLLSAQLHIHLLGPPEVNWQGELLSIPRRQARALLFRLAVSAQPVAREALCFLFWPDVGEAKARHNLSRLLTILHNTLPDAGSLLARDDQIALHPERTGSDTRIFEETRNSPYQPLVEALRPHLLMRRLEFEVYPAWLAELAQLFPELRPAHPGLAQPPAGELGWARTRLFEALETLLLRLAQGVQPVVPCLDDLHWADSATLDWLTYLGRHSRNRPLLLVAAYRSAEADPLLALRASLTQQGMLRELALEGLDQDAVRELLRHLGGPFAADRTLAGRLCQATAGNPFFLLEILAALLEAGEPYEPAIAPQALPLPASVRATVQMRVGQLSPTARQVLEAAAVVGPAFAYDTLHLTAGRAELETADALDELTGRQFLAQEPGQVRFRHDIVREVVYRGLNAYRRSLLHQRAGEALERTRPEEAAALARHFAGAGQPGYAARYAMQAGLAARRIFAHVEARSHFDQAVALLEHEAGALRDPEAIAANRRLRIEALSQRGWALRLLGEMDAYAQDLEQEAQLAALLGDSDTLAHLRWRQASAHLWFCRYAAARAAAEEGLRLCQAVGDQRLEAACWRALGLAARAHSPGLLPRRSRALRRLHRRPPHRAALRRPTAWSLTLDADPGRRSRQRRRHLLHHRGLLQPGG